LKLSHLPVNLAAKPFFKWSLKVNPRTRNRTSRLWWFTPVIPAFRRLRQEDREFEASLGYITASKKNKNKKRQRHGGQEREREIKAEPLWLQQRDCLTSYPLPSPV
jgi:hypothetical protein